MAMLLDFATYDFPENHCKASTVFDRDILDFLAIWRKQDTFDIKTSGSTGKPKVITLSKEQMQNSAKMTGEFFGFQKGQTALLCLPIDKIAGIMMLVRAVVWRLKLYTTPPKLALNLQTLPEINFAPLIPKQALENLSEIKKIKTILIGGASVPEHLLAEIQVHPSNFFHSYGMTETISHIAICNLQKEYNNYTALPHVHIAVNEDNCLQITAPFIGIKKLQTNDIVLLNSANSFKYLGRIDTIINSGGLKIIAEEIEAQIAPYITENFYIKGTPDNSLGEKVTLFIEANDWNETKKKSLSEVLCKIKPKQAIPKTIIFKKSFSYTSTGKIIK